VPLKSLATLIFTLHILASFALAEGSPPQLVIDIGGHAGEVYIAGTTVDNHLITYGFDKTIRIWDQETGSSLKTIRGQIGPEDQGKIIVAPSPDKRYLAIGGKPGKWGVRLLDLESEKIIRVFTFDQENMTTDWDHIDQVAFSADGSRLMASGLTKGARVWDVRTGKELISVRYQVTDTRFFSALSPDGKRLVVSGFNQLTLWNVDSGRKISQKKYTIGAGAFTPDGKMFIGATMYDRTLEIFNGKSLSHVKRMDKYAGYVRDLAISQDGKRIVVSESLKYKSKAYAHAYNLAPEPDELSRFSGHSNDISSVYIMGDNRTAASGDADGTICFWNTQSGNLIKQIKGAGLPVRKVAFADTGNTIAWGNRDRLEYYFSLSGLSSSPTNPDPDAHYTGPLFQTAKVTFGQEKAPYGDFMTTTVKTGWSRGKTKPVAGADWSQVRTLTSDSAFVFLTTLNYGYSYYGISKINLAPQGDFDFYEQEAYLKGHVGPITSLVVSPDNRLLLSGATDKTIRLWDIAQNRLLLTIFLASENEWVAWTPEGYFTCSENGAKYFGWQVNQGVDKLAKFYPASQLYDDYYRPDLVQAKLQGEFEQIVSHSPVNIDIAEALSTGSAPLIDFVSPQSSLSASRDIEAVIVLTDQGGGIGKLVWKLNGITVGVAEANRGITLNKKDSTGSVKVSRLLTLSPGENRIEVIAYNAEEKIASDPEELKVTLKDAISEKPSLHILAVGINKYRDKSLWLNYAVPDAQSLVKKINTASKSIFTRVNVTEVYDQQANINGIDQAFKSLGESAKSSDVFILYLAGHGITQDGKYHFLPADFRFRNEDSIRQSAITQDHLQAWMSRVPAQKSLVLLDTCNSGSFVQAQAVTRGMAEKTAIVKLTRATGRATIAASTDSQVALEGYEGHGVFTYALLKALTEADLENGNRDGVTSTAEIASYIDNTVPDLTYKKWGYEQVPQVNLHGREFPIGVTQ